MKKVFSLYRGKSEEIQRQRIGCHICAGLQGWIIGKEFYEPQDSNNISDDSIMAIRGAAINKEFNVLMVYEYDNIGRDKYETPFAVKWFIDNNIDVVSVKYENRDFDKEINEILESIPESVKTYRG